MIVGDRHNCCLHVCRAHNVDDVGACWNREVCGGDECDLCTTRQGLGRNRVTLLSRGAIRDDAHRIDGLASSTCSDEHTNTRKIVICRKHTFDCRNNVSRFSEATGADIATSKAAFAGRDNDDATRSEQRQVVLHRGVFPHFSVHGRTNDDWRACRNERRCEQVIGITMGVGRDQSCRCWGHNNQIVVLTETSVRNGRGFIP